MVHGFGDPDLSRRRHDGSSARKQLNRITFSWSTGRPAGRQSDAFKPGGLFFQNVTQLLLFCGPVGDRRQYRRLRDESVADGFYPIREFLRRIGQVTYPPYMAGGLVEIGTAADICEQQPKRGGTNTPAKSLLTMQQESLTVAPPDAGRGVLIQPRDQTAIRIMPTPAGVKKIS